LQNVTSDGQRGESPIRIDDAYLRILVVEKDPDLRQLLVSTLSQFGFGCESVPDSTSALETLRGAAKVEAGPTLVRGVDAIARAGGNHHPGVFGLVICDAKMPDHDGLWLLDRLRESYNEVSVIVLTGTDRSRVAVECMRRGATDCLAKPIDMDELLVAVDQALEKRRLVLENRAYRLHLEQIVDERTRALQSTLRKLNESYGETILALAAALDAREQETANHSGRVAEGTVSLLASLGVDDELDVIHMGAMLHDIGKIGIPDGILLKAGPLDRREWEIMRRHPLIGYEILREVQFLEPSLELVLYHQERFDGGGYPFGLRGNDIPLSARAFAVVDAWDAMTNPRPYRDAMPNSQAMIELLRCAGQHFDPEVVDAFFERVRDDGGLDV
jgi:putative nucleotidyltransferase with HDIG domain